MWSRWLALLKERESGTSLALFRIACGLTVVCTIGMVVVHGLAPVIWLDAADGGYATLDGPPWLFRLMGGVNPFTLWLMIGVCIGFGLALMAGWGGRLTAFVVLQSFLAISNINSHIGGCDDQLIGNALWLLVLSRSTTTLSLDCRWRSGSWSSAELIPAWPRYLAIFQIVLVYFTTGLQKVSITWTPAGGYSSLYYLLQEPGFQRWDMSWLAWVYPLTQIATAVTWFWEVSSPLLLLALWYRRTRARPGRRRAFFNRIHFRELFVAIGLAVHLGVWILIDLGPFTWITLSFYICLFRPEEWSALGARAVASGQGPVVIKADSASLATDHCSLTPATAAESRSPMADSRLLAAAGTALITFHVVAITMMAMPSPPPGMMSEQDRQAPIAQEEFAAWAEFFSSLGISVTAKELQDRLWHLANGYLSIRTAVLTPFQWYYTACGTRQGWRMFVAPSREPTRLFIDVQEAGQWRAVFGEGLRDLAWRGGQLNQEHMRTALITLVVFEHDFHEDLEQFARWLAARARRDFPRAQRLRLRIHKQPTPTPEQVREGRRPLGQDSIPVVVQLVESGRS
jgi:hypothetical protein